MLKKYNHFFITVIYLADIASVYFAWILSYYVRFYSGLIPIYKDLPTFDGYLVLSVYIVLIWTISVKIFNLYQPVRGRSQLFENYNIFKVSTVSILLMTSVTFFYREYSYSRIVFLIFWFLSTFAIMGTHLLVRKILYELRKKGINVKHIIIVGDGELGEKLINNIRLHPEIGLSIKGIITEKTDNIGIFFNKIQVIGHIDNITELLHKHKPDQIFVALPMESYGNLDSLLNTIRDETIDIKIIPDILRFIKINPSIEEFEGLPVVNISESPLFGWHSFMKRFLDIILSSAIMIVILPFLAIIAIIVKKSSPGPTLYKQERMGMDGERFFIYKFRTMPVDAETESGPVWAKKHDGRSTKFGKFLRKTSLDELPQLFNVIEGKMSLVGPRPERPVFVDEFRKSVPKYMLRHKIKAGMTGWAQINGFRGNTSIIKRIEYDIYYIENWSILFDLKILLLTIFKGFISPNAY